MADFRCHGNLGLSAEGFFTPLAVTHPSILSPHRSSGARASAFNAVKMLPYREAQQSAFSVLLSECRPLIAERWLRPRLRCPP